MAVTITTRKPGVGLTVRDAMTALFPKGYADHKIYKEQLAAAAESANR